VLVDISKDALQATTRFSWPPKVDLPGYHPGTRPHAKQIRAAAQLIREARRPVLYVGGGVIRARASDELRELVELTQIPLVTTLMARGAVPDSHPLHLGMPGMHGAVAAVTSLQKADLLIALGTRFDDRVTGQLSTFAPHAKVIHADIDPAEISKNRVADVPIVGDCRAVIVELLDALRDGGSSDEPELSGEGREHTTGNYAPWRRQVQEWKATYPVGYTAPEGGSVAPQHVIERIGALSGPDATFVSGVGQHQMWAAQFVQYERPNSWLNSGGLGTMGYAVPAAMGAKAAEPDRVVWAIDGDGCFQMTNQELATCVINDIPIKVAVVNNSSLGMVRQWQTLFYNERYSNTDLHTSHGGRVPDFVKLAEAYGCVGLRCERPEDVDTTIQKALEINDVPVVIDFVVHRDAMVWPMVPAGVSNDLITTARAMTPVWDRSDEEAGE
jgi:acetolactate synthase-1/2/3 large subunit